MTDVYKGEDGLVRRVSLEYNLSNETTFRKVDRAIHGIAVIVPVEEQCTLVVKRATDNNHRSFGRGVFRIPLTDDQQCCLGSNTSNEVKRRGASGVHLRIWTV